MDEVDAAGERTQPLGAARQRLGIPVEPEQLGLRQRLEQGRGVTAAAERAVDDPAHGRPVRPARQEVEGLVQEDGQVLRHGRFPASH